MMILVITSRTQCLSVMRELMLSMSDLICFCDAYSCVDLESIKQFYLSINVMSNNFSVFRTF